MSEYERAVIERLDLILAELRELRAALLRLSTDGTAIRVESV